MKRVNDVRLWATHYHIAYSQILPTWAVILIWPRDSLWLKRKIVYYNSTLIICGAWGSFVCLSSHARLWSLDWNQGDNNWSISEAGDNNYTTEILRRDRQTYQVRLGPIPVLTLHDVLRGAITQKRWPWGSPLICQDSHTPLACVITFLINVQA